MVNPWWYLVVLVGLFVCCGDGADILSSSKLDSCIRSSTGLDNETSINCTQKISILLSINNGDQGTTEIQAQLQGATVNGSAVTFADPLSIKLHKSPVGVLYPLIYVQSVNGQPEEQVIGRGWDLSPPSCQDGTNDDSTCGWFLDASGNKIPYSNGFCCRCSIGNVFENDDVHRGNLDCKPFGGRMSSAHCLNFNPSWWDIFAVEPSQIGYKITVEISGAGLESPYNLTMDETAPFFVNPEATLSGRIVGDFGTVSSNPTFDSYNLLIPTRPGNSPKVLGGVKNWMMVPKDLFDLTGAGCNKIGISHDGFYAQGSRCSSIAGSCLYNQPDALFNSDNTLRAYNKTPTYLVERWGKFEPVFPSITAPNTFKLKLLPPGIQNTLVTLNVKADAVRFITNRSTGKIAYGTIRDFVTFSRDGIIYTAAVNTGVLVAEYFLTISNFTTIGVLPVPPQQFAIQPFMTHNTTFQVYSQNLFSTSDQATITLYDSTYQILDTLTLFFNTTMYEVDDGAQGGNSSRPPGAANFGTPAVLTCAEKCPGFFSIICFIGTKCWMQILYVLLFIVGCILTIVLLVKTRCCARPCAAGAKFLRRKKGKNTDKTNNDSPSKKKKKNKKGYSKTVSKKKDISQVWYNTPVQPKRQRVYEESSSDSEYEMDNMENQSPPVSGKSKSGQKKEISRSPKSVTRTRSPSKSTGSASRTTSASKKPRSIAPVHMAALESSSGTPPAKKNVLQSIVRDEPPPVSTFYSIPPPESEDSYSTSSVMIGLPERQDVAIVFTVPPPGHIPPPPTIFAFSTTHSIEFTAMAAPSQPVVIVPEEPRTQVPPAPPPKPVHHRRPSHPTPTSHKLQQKSTHGLPPPPTSPKPKKYQKQEIEDPYSALYLYKPHPNRDDSSDSL